jgi:CheY-like chemotaxis protein
MTSMRGPGERWGGTLRISLRRVVADTRLRQVHADAEDRDYWVLAVQDTGIGIAPENEQLVFTPFYTTKAAGQGTGLGLSMAYSVAKAHGGFVTLRSAPGVGSTFSLFLPAMEGERAGPTVPAPDGAIALGTGTILVVDDEEVVRRLASRILEECGYTVLTAANGEEGASIFGSLEGNVDLVLLDLMMPVLSGRETYYRLREIRPDVRVLLSSGFRDDLRVKELLAAGVVAFLDKPYTLESLARAVDAALRAGKDADRPA